MYAQLGGTVFRGLFGMDSFSRTREVKTVDIELINNKPRIQRTGQALAQLAISITLGTEWVDSIADTIQGLHDSMESGEVLPLLGGDGTVYGDFIIISIGDEITDMSTSGIVSGATLSLTLKEWVDPNPVRTIQEKARSTAFAVDTTRVVPVNVLAQGKSVMGQTVESVRIQQNATTEAGVLIKRAVINPTEKLSLFRRALAKIDITRLSVQELVITLIQNEALEAKAPGLLDAAQDLSNQADNLRLALLNENLTNALNYSDLIQADISRVRAAALPLDNIVLQRKPQ